MTSTSALFSSATARLLAALLWPSPKPAVVLRILGCVVSITCVFISGISVASMEICVQYRENDNFPMSKEKDDKILKLSADEKAEKVERLKVSSDEDAWLDDALFEEDDKVLDSVVEGLFEEEKKEVVSKGMARRGEDELKSLLNEKIQRKDSDMEAKVRKALSGENVSKADRLRMKSATATERSLDDVLADRKGVEELWEESETEIARTSSTWKVGLLLLSVLIGGLFWAIWQAYSKDNVGGADAQEKISEGIDDDNAHKLKIQEMSARAEKAVLKYIQATTIEEKLAVSANAEEVASFMQEYYQKFPIEPNFKDVVLIAPSETFKGRSIWTVGIGPANSTIINRSFFVVLENGEMKVDWEADVGWQRNSLTEFLKTKSTKPTAFLARVELAYQNGMYGWGFNDKEYRCVKLYIRENDDPKTKETLIWGFVKYRSVTHRDIDEHQRGGGRSLVNDTRLNDRLILDIRFLEGTSEHNTDCVLIEKVVSPKWMKNNILTTEGGKNDR